MTRLLLPAMVLAGGVMVFVHAVVYGHGVGFVSFAPYFGFDVLLAVPVAGAALVCVGLLRRRWSLAVAASAAALAVVFGLLLVPLVTVQVLGHSVLGASGVHDYGVSSVTGAAGVGLSVVLRAWPVVVVAALVAVLVQRLVAGPGWRRWLWRRVLGSRRPVVAVSSAGALVAGLAVVSVLPASPAVASHQSGCDAAPTRTYDVAAVDVEITINRHGDNDPFGYMYVLQDNLAQLRAEEAALRKAGQTQDFVDPETGEVSPWPELVAADPDARLVSSGLGQDLIQPLVLRARLGECVVINLRNDLTRAPVSGPANRLFEFPGGVPSVSMDMQGVAFDAAGGDGGQAVGTSGGSAMVAPGQSGQYRFFLDPAMGEGTKVFRSGGESTQLTAHGLFGALIAEPAGARWFDPVTGADVTDEATWSGWEAMVQAPDEPTFREFAILYHEIGDEEFTLRRPLREAFGGATSPRPDPFDDSADPRMIGGSLMMVDRRGPDQDQAFRRGGGTNSYRPGSRAINYRSESFFRRLQHESALVFNAGGDEDQAAQEQLENKSLGYSSYTYGDPATPIPRSYLGEPTKTRLAHVGFEQLHVHHLHGGGDRWRQNPDADDTDMDGGLRKFPIQDAQSIRLDSQTISPGEAFSLEHECGAGGCQQAAGDFLYHCHIAHHYIAGMWGFWRVFDTAQDDLAPLPGDYKPDQAVTSAELLGTTLAPPDGRTVVLDSQVVDPDTQVGLESLVEGQLPAQGVRIDKDDATVWDWVKTGPASAPLYLGEPDYGDVNNPNVNELRSWENYRSDTPGVRHPILFNPGNGRPAFPMLVPHLGYRPPFSPNGHSGAPWLGEDGSTSRPDGLCPTGAPLREYDITAVSLDIPVTNREVDTGGMLFTLSQDKDDLLAGNKPAQPLTIRSNVGDCVNITMTNQIDNAAREADGFKQLPKTNMHTHFVQFDPLASDGVITGLSYEQSVYSTQRDGRVLVSIDDPDTVTVNHVNRLREGITIAVGAGTDNIEIRQIVDITGNQLHFDQPLTNTHQVGTPVTVEFVQYRWYSDVDSGTVFWHDHVDGIMSWAHGLFGAHIIEPAGSTYHDPVTGAQVDSGTIVDIHAPGDTSVGVGQSGSFREYMIFLHNGRPAKQEPTRFTFGQECEAASINLRAEPFGERTPEGTIITDPDTGQPLDVDPTTTAQRFEYNGFEAANGCRNPYTRHGDPATNQDTVAATVTTVDPYVFSSVKYGEPTTPTFRAYLDDDVVIRTLGINERGEALRFQGHRFRMERFNNDGQLMDAAITGISERFDYILDGGAGGHRGMPGDYLYYSTRQFALESGAWGIFRVHNKQEPDLQPLPDNYVPTGSGGFPTLTPAEGDTQTNPGPNPPNATSSTVVGPTNPCPWYAPLRNYHITAFNHELPTSPFPDTEGIIYSLSADYHDIQNGTKPVEPLVLRANRGDCIKIVLDNKIDSGALYGGDRAGIATGMLTLNPQFDGGTAIGLNPDSTVARNNNRTYLFYADKEVGTTTFTNLGSPASMRHGAYGLLIVEPQGSQWLDSFTGEQLGANKTATQAAIYPPHNPAYREFALAMHTTDQQYSRSIIPYMDVVAGNGINPSRDSGGQPTLKQAPIAGAPPGTTNTNGSYNKAFTHLNYTSEPLTTRIGLTNAPGYLDDGQPGWFDPGFQVDQPYHNAFNSTIHGDPDTPIVQTYAGDPVVFRIGVPTSDQLHALTISGHTFPLEPHMTGTQHMEARTLTAGMTLDAHLSTPAGGTPQHHGDYYYGDNRQPFTGAGLWGIFRIHPDPNTSNTNNFNTTTTNEPIINLD